MKPGRINHKDHKKESEQGVTHIICIVLRSPTSIVCGNEATARLLE
jgi:hypothetical protein